MFARGRSGDLRRGLSSGRSEVKDVEGGCEGRGDGPASGIPKARAEELEAAGGLFLHEFKIKTSYYRQTSGPKIAHYTYYWNSTCVSLGYYTCHSGLIHLNKVLVQAAQSHDQPVSTTPR